MASTMLSASPPQTLATDDSLVALAMAGDAAAYRAIFYRHAPGVRRFLGDLLRRDEAADEATQEVFVRAHKKLDSLRDANKLSSWLLGIARLVAFERRREDRRQRLREVDNADAPELELVDRRPSPEERLLGHEADGVLQRALASLDEERRAAMLLRLDHGLGYAEIADHMGWSVQKVKNEIHRGRRQLRRLVEPYLGGRA